MIKTFIYLLLVLLLNSSMCSSVARADSLRCESHLVSLGDTKEEVEGICGSPTFVDSSQEERVIKTYYSKKHRDGELKDEYEFLGERSSIVNLEEWTYNFGSSRFIQTLKFKDNKLVSIKAGDYGFDEVDDDFSVKKGDSKAMIWMKYGKPLDIQKKSTYETNVTRERDGDYLYEEKCLTPIVEEEWIYDIGSDHYLQKLIFRDNRLVSFKSLKVKGKKPE